MRHYLLACLISSVIFICGSILCAQEASPSPALLQAPNEILLEAGGRGGSYSLSYELQIIRELSLNVGIAPSSNVQTSAFVIGYTFAMNFHFAEAPSRIFMDFGISYLPGANNSRLVPLPSLGIGYRYRPNRSAVTFKGEVLAIAIDDIGIVPWAGLAIGYSF